MYFPKYCPECGESRSGLVETAPEHLGCQMCGMEFKVELTYDIDAKIPIIKEEENTCNNCGLNNDTDCPDDKAHICKGNTSF